MKRIIILLTIFVLTLFMTSCENKTKNDENYDSLGASEIVDESPHNYTLSEYLKSGKTLILYEVKSSEIIEKDDIIYNIIIFKDNLVSEYISTDNPFYTVKTTVSEIEKMTDEEIIEFCEQSCETIVTNIEYQFEVYTDGTGNYTDHERIVSLNEVSKFNYLSRENYYDYYYLNLFNNYYVNTTATVYDSTFYMLPSDSERCVGRWYRPDGYILSLDSPDSDNVIVDPE